MAEPKLGKPVESTKGHLDVIVRHRISGRPLDQDKPDDPVLVEITVDVKSVGRATVEENRDDAAKVFDTNGKHDFSGTIPEPLHDGKSYLAGAFFAGTPIAEDNSPQTTLFDLPHRSQSLTRNQSWIGPIFEVHADSPVEGQLFGWALEVEHSEKREVWDLFSDRAFVKTEIADRGHHDLVGKGDGSCRNGCLMAVPPQFSDKNGHAIDVLIPETEVRLVNAPAYLPLPVATCLIEAMADFIRLEGLGEGGDMSGSSSDLTTWNPTTG